MREMQIETIMRYHLTPVRWPISKRPETSAGEVFWKKESSYTALWESTLVHPQWKAEWRLIHQISLSCDTPIPLVEIYPKVDTKSVI